MDPFSPAYDVSIVIPTLNEADNIDPLLTAVFAAVDGQPFRTQVVVVDDGSTDATRARVRGWAKRRSVFLVERDNERGLAGAVLAGAQVALGDVVVVMDADQSHPAEVLPQLIGPVLDGRCDMTIGSRYVRDGATVGWPLRRKLISRSASLLAWPLVDVADPMSGYFALRREQLISAGLEARGFKIGLELLVRATPPPRVIEVPIVFREREAGQSKLGAGQITAYLSQLRMLGGGCLSGSSAMRFGLVGLLGVLVDSVSFSLLMLIGLQLSASQLSSFVIASLFNFVLNARWSFRSRDGLSAASGLSTAVRYFVVLLLALSLRAAVLGSLVGDVGLTPSLSVFFAIGMGALVSYLGCAFFVFPASRADQDRAIRWRIACVGVVSYLLLLRFFHIGLTELLMEEAYYWNYSNHPSMGYLDHPPMVAWLIGLGTWLFGNTEFGVRIGAVACWCVTVWFGYAMAREMFNKSVAMCAMLLLAILPFFFVTGFFMTPDAPLAACWAGALYFLQRVLLGGNRKAWWGVGLCIGLGMLSKYSIALLGPSILLYLLLDKRSRHWFVSWRPYAAVALAVAVFSPVIYWNATHEWASFAFQSVRRLESKPVFGLHLLVGSVLLLLTPVGVIALLRVLGTGVRAQWAKAGLQRFALSDKHLFALVFTVVPLSVFVFFSFQHEPKLNWTGPVWLAAIPLLAARVLPGRAMLNALTPSKHELAWARLTACVVLGYSLFLYYTSIGLPGVSYPDQFMFAGWRDLGYQVEAMEDAIEHERGAEPLVVGLDKYGTASRLAFYRFRDEPDHWHPDDKEGFQGTSGRHLFGGDSLMYAYWHGDSTMLGRDVILIDEDPQRLADQQLGGYFDRLSPVKSLTVSAHGQRAGQFYCRVGYGYHLPFH